MSGCSQVRRSERKPPPIGIVKTLSKQDDKDQSEKAKNEEDPNARATKSLIELLHNDFRVGFIGSQHRIGNYFCFLFSSISKKVISINFPGLTPCAKD